MNIKNKRFIIDFLLNIGCHFSNLKINEVLRVYNEEIVSGYEFVSKSLFVKPNIQILYSYKFLKVGLYAGYNLTTKNVFLMKNNKDIMLVNPSQSGKVKSDWEGFQYGLTIYTDILCNNE